MVAALLTVCSPTPRRVLGRIRPPIRTDTCTITNIFATMSLRSDSVTFSGSECERLSEHQVGIGRISFFSARSIAFAKTGMKALA